MNFSSSKRAFLFHKFLTDPVIRIVSLPDKLLVKILKPNAARIGDFWDKKREFLKEPGFKGQNNLGNYYLLLSRYSIESEQSVIELIDLKNFKTFSIRYCLFFEYSTMYPNNFVTSLNLSNLLPFLCL